MIGTKRGGTTTLLRYLQLHPQVLPMWPGVENAKKTWYFDDNFHRGEEWYRAHFASRWQRARTARAQGDPVVTGEAAPYYLFHPAVPDRVAATLPDVKVLVLLRNPVERAWSHWRERRNMGTEVLDLAAALDAEPGRLAGEEERIRADPRYRSDAHDHFSYLARGRYLEQLERWWRRLDADRVHIARSEDLYADPGTTMAEVQRFLGVRPVGVSRPHHYNEHPGPVLHPDLRQRLADYYRPEVAQLEERLGRDLGWRL